MTQRAGRITCPRCGANNFDTVSVCWKCSTPLGTGSATPPPVASPPSRNAPASAASTSAPPSATFPTVPPTPFPSPTPSPAERFGYAAPAMTAGAGGTGNPAAANRAAIWLGLLFPYFGLPIGLAFIMCDDRRRQEVGRICILWSLVSTAIHLLLMFITLLGMRELLFAALQGVRGGLNRPGGLGGDF